MGIHDSNQEGHKKSGSPSAQLQRPHGSKALHHPSSRGHIKVHPFITPTRGDGKVWGYVTLTREGKMKHGVCDPHLRGQTEGWESIPQDP